MYSGHRTCTVGTAHVQWAPHMYSGHRTCTVGTAHVQWALHMYSGDCTCTVGTVHVQWAPHMYSGHCTCTVGTAHVQWAPHMYSRHCTCTVGTVHEDRYTFFITSRSLLLIMTNVSDKICRETQTTHFVFFFENRAVYEIMWKILYSRAGHRWQ